MTIITAVCIIRTHIVSTVQGLGNKTAGVRFKVSGVPKCNVDRPHHVVIHSTCASAIQIVMIYWVSCRCGQSEGTVACSSHDLLWCTLGTTKDQTITLDCWRRWVWHHCLSKLAVNTRLGVPSQPVWVLLRLSARDWSVESQCPAMGSHFIVAVVISLCCQPVIVVSGELQLYWFTGDEVYIEII